MFLARVLIHHVASFPAAVSRKRRRNDDKAEVGDREVHTKRGSRRSPYRRLTGSAVRCADDTQADKDNRTHVVRETRQVIQSEGGFFLQNEHAMFFSGFYILSVCTFMQSYSIILELFVFLVCCCCCLKYNRDMQYNARPWLETRTVTLLTSFRNLIDVHLKPQNQQGRRTKRPACSLFSEIY